MIDLMTAVRGAVFRALQAGVTTVPVYDDLPENTQPPFVKLGAVDSTADPSKGEQLEQITFDVVAVYRGRDRGKLLAMIHAARQALDHKPLTVTGVSIQQVRLLTASASDVAADGVTYAGLSTFELIAEPA